MNPIEIKNHLLRTNYRYDIETFLNKTHLWFSADIIGNFKCIYIIKNVHHKGHKLEYYQFRGYF
jgi:hypothetical protein